MATSSTLKEFPDQRQVVFELIPHPHAGSSMEAAQQALLPAMTEPGTAYRSIGVRNKPAPGEHGLGVREYFDVTVLSPVTQLDSCVIRSS